MMKSLLAPAVGIAALPFVTAGALSLEGQESFIQFHDGAKLSASCPSSGGASFKWVKPTKFTQYLPGDSQSMKVYLRGVPETCFNSPIDVPCADDEGEVPALFFCNYKGPSGAAAVGPFPAARERAAFLMDPPLGVRVFLTCPLPVYEEVERITAVDGVQAASPQMELMLSYMKSVTDGGSSIPFDGMDGGSMISIDGLAPPPPSTPPSVPPPRSPPPSTPPMSPPPPLNPPPQPSPPPPTPPPPPPTCKNIKEKDPSAPSGVYDTLIGSVYCDMDSMGGGWTLCANWVDNGAKKLNGWAFWSQDNHKSSMPGLSYPSEAAGDSSYSPYGVQGISECHAMAQDIGATEFKYACGRDYNQNTHDGESAAITCTDDTCGNIGEGGNGMVVSDHTEWGWGGYGNSKARAVGTSSYPSCGGNSCNFCGWNVATSGMVLEVAAGGTSIGGRGCCNGCQHDRVDEYSGGQQGVSCGGVNTQGSSTDRFSILLR